MFTAKSWISFFTGIIIFCLGLFPFIKNVLNSGPAWFGLNLPMSVFALIVAGAGFFLLIDSFAEILNNYSVGWITGIIGILCMVLGIMNAVLGQFKWLNPTIFYIISMIEGIFLIIAWIAGAV